VLDAIGFYQENRDQDESVYHKMEKAHALNEKMDNYQDVKVRNGFLHRNEYILKVSLSS
jgi:p21-activated kinase 1